MRALYVVCCLGVMWASARAAHAELPKQLRGQFVKARSALESAESKLKAKRDASPGSDEAKKAADTASERLAKAERFAEGLPADDSEVGELLARINAARAEIEKMRAANGEADVSAAKDSAELETGLSEDLGTLEAINEKLVAARFLTGDSLEIDGLELWSKVEKDGLALVAKYEGKAAKSDAAKKMVRAVDSLSTELRDSRSRMQEYLTKFLPQKIEQYLKQAESLATPANQKNNIDYFVQGLAYSNRSKIFLRKFEILAPSFNGTDMALVAPARARVEAIEARVASAKEQVAATNKPPLDVYKGSDKEALRAKVKSAWTSVNPHLPPLKVTVPGENWSRQTRWEWKDTHWRKIDISTLAGFVFFKGDDKTAFGYSVYIVKDHQDGDNLRFRVDPIKPVPANWEQVYLLSRI